MRMGFVFVVASFSLGCGSVKDPARDAGLDAAPPGCDPTEEPGLGVFASATNGDDEAGDGSPLLPFETIEAAIGFAVASGQSQVYLEEGTYREAVRFRDAPAGIFVEGGWVATGATWTRSCAEGVMGRTVIAAPASEWTAVLSDGVVHASGLRLLTVTTKAAGASPPNEAGETLVGVLVRGAGSVFSLTDVIVTAGDGGDGGAAAAGPAGADGGSCDRLAGCSTGAAGLGNSTPGAPAARPGEWTATGYSPGDGSAGGAGTPGQLGTAPAAGPGSRNDCVSGCTCVGGSSCQADSIITVRGADGLCGCGGGAGGAGAAGRGGGASVALLAEGDDVNVSVTRGALQAGDGGDGSQGGAGGEGGAGTDGSPGAEQTCWTGCGTGGAACDVNCGSVNEVSVSGGVAGGRGGDGGQGSRGGAGAGGTAHAVVRIGAATVVTRDTAVSIGQPGTGAGTGDAKAPDGTAGEELVVEP